MKARLPRIHTLKKIVTIKTYESLQSVFFPKSISSKLCQNAVAPNIYFVG